MRRVKQTVPVELCRARALFFLLDKSSLMNAASVADAIWTDQPFMARQGAGAAGSRILTDLKKAGLVEWHVLSWAIGPNKGRPIAWGYRITGEGRRRFASHYSKVLSP